MKRECKTDRTSPWKRVDGNKHKKGTLRAENFHPTVISPNGLINGQILKNHLSLYVSNRKGQKGPFLRMNRSVLMNVVEKRASEGVSTGGNEKEAEKSARAAGTICSFAFPLAD